MISIKGTGFLVLAIMGLSSRPALAMPSYNPRNLDAYACITGKDAPPRTIDEARNFSAPDDRAARDFCLRQGPDLSAHKIGPVPSHLMQVWQCEVAQDEHKSICADPTVLKAFSKADPYAGYTVAARLIKPSA